MAKDKCPSCDGEKDTRANQCSQCHMKYNPPRLGTSRWTLHSTGYYTRFVDGRRMYLHGYKVEQYLGRILEKGECVHHIDGDRNNNDASNLEWCTRSENMIHAHKNGLTNPSSLFTSGDSRRSDKSKLSNDEVAKIRARFDNGEKASSIWRDFKKVNYSNLRRCCKRESFRSII